jgi:Tfp pilus tip-associated adhesin PilY1
VGRGPKKVVAEYLDGELGTLDDPLPDLVFLLENDIAIVYASEKVGSEVSYAPPTVLGHQGQGPVDLAVKDINGDGYADIVVLDKQGAVYVYLNLAKRQFSSPFLFQTGLSPQKMTVADLDADGCMDIATADSGGKTVTILQALSCGGK